MSTTALEIDAPQLRATQLVARPGTLPTITFPMIGGRWPDVAGIWQYLRETAEYFCVHMPGSDDLAAAIAGFAAAGPASAAVNVTIAAADGAPQILVSGTAVTQIRPDAVRIAGGDSLPMALRATDPRWRRMAARTTSRGDVDHVERWLSGRGFADAISGDVLLLGALVLQTSHDVVGMENPEPTSILDQLAQCGAISMLGRVDVLPTDAQRAWWISPGYETHPVVEVGGIPFHVDAETALPFSRSS